MFKKGANTFLLAAGLFAAAGVSFFLEEKIYLSITFIALSATNIAIFSKTNIETKEVSTVCFEKVKEDKEFNTHIADNKKIAAIKRCRQITFCGLKEAKDFVDSNY